MQRKTVLQHHRTLPFVLISLVLTLLIFSSPVVAQPQTAPPEQPRRLTLEAALAIALRESSAAQRAALNLEDRLVEALALEHQHEAGPPPETCFPSFEFSDEGLILSGEQCVGPSDYEVSQIEHLLPRQAAALRESAAAGYRQEMAALQSDVINTYYDAVLASAAAEAHQAHRRRVSEHLSRARQSLTQGVIAPLDFDQADAGFMQAEAEVFAGEEQARLALLALKEQIGLPLDSEGILVANVPPWTPEDRDLEEDLATALAAGAELEAARGQLNVAQKDLELFHEHAGSFRGRKSYRQREINVALAQLNLTDAERRTEISVRGIHSQLEQLQQHLAVAERQVELARQVADLAKLRFDIGLATTLDVLEAEANLLQAQLGHLQALIQAHNAQAQLNVLLGVIPAAVEERLETTIEQVGGLL